jgi:hypothetical protein
MVGNEALASFLPSGNNFYFLNEKLERMKGIGIIPIGEKCEYI